MPAPVGRDNLAKLRIKKLSKKVGPGEVLRMGKKVLLSRWRARTIRRCCLRACVARAATHDSQGWFAFPVPVLPPRKLGSLERTNDLLNEDSQRTVCSGTNSPSLRRPATFSQRLLSFSENRSLALVRQLSLAYSAFKLVQTLHPVMCMLDNPLPSVKPRLSLAKPRNS